MARKDDRRVLRTRKTLRESLLALILDRGYDDISIQDITDRANLGRATFYLHYREKDELLEDLLRQFSEEFLGANSPLSITGAPFLHQKAVQKLFEFTADHYDLFRIMTIGRGSVIATRKLMAVMRDAAGQALDELQEKGSMPPLGESKRFLENYLAGSLLALLYWWLDNDMPYTPAEMAAMYQKVSPMTQPGSFTDLPEIPEGSPRSLSKKEKKTAAPKKDHGQKETASAAGKQVGQ